jgi:hypothetical protein
MVEAEEVKEELRATYRPDLDIEERVRRVTQRLAVNERQRQIITAKMDAMLEMRRELEEKVLRNRSTLADLEKQRKELPEKPKA